MENKLKIIVAGAGAGKTTKMSEKVIDLRKTVNREKIIYCITFTNTAVSCIRKKLEEKYGAIPLNVKVTTIHSFLYREFINPYNQIIFGKHYEKISTTKLPNEIRHANYRIKGLEEKNILHQTVIPKRAKWIIDRKSGDKKIIKVKREIVLNIFKSYCGAICIDEAQDIDADMYDIIKKLIELDITIYMVGDPKQDLKGFKKFNELIAEYKQMVTYDNNCYRCPKKHISLTNKIVNDNEKQVSNNNVEETISIVFESDLDYKELIKLNKYDLIYISKKQGCFETHKKDTKNCLINLYEELVPIVKKYKKQLSDMKINIASYHLSTRMIADYNEYGNSKKAMSILTSIFHLEPKEYATVIDIINSSSYNEDATKIYVKSIDSVKGDESENCLFILTPDLAPYLFMEKIDENKTKNKLYVALTRSLKKLTIFITERVEERYSKDFILEFLKSNE